MDIYRDLIENGGVFTPEEYRGETQKTLKEVKKDMEISQLLIDYLDFINKPKKFYIARKQQVDGPLREIYNILKSDKIDQEYKTDIKEYLFTNIMALGGDTTRRIRELKAVFEDRNLSKELLEEVEDDEILDDITDYFNELDVKSETVELSSELVEKIKSTTEEFVERKKYKNARNQPLELLNKAFKTLNEIDTEALVRLDEVSKKEFKDLLGKVEQLVNELSDI